MRSCVNPPEPRITSWRGKSTLFLALLFILGCAQEAADYGFKIKNVSVSRGYQVLHVQVAQQLELSQQAREAVRHGVTLSIVLELELRNDDNLIAVKQEYKRFDIRYLPLTERFQLTEDDSEKQQTFSRLRHALASIDDLDVRMSTGPLPEGSYQLRTRIHLDETMLPAPMQLPAWFSAQWQHDSEWTVWPFKVNA